MCNESSTNLIFFLCFQNLLQGRIENSQLLVDTKHTFPVLFPYTPSALSLETLHIPASLNLSFLVRVWRLSVFSLCPSMSSAESAWEQRGEQTPCSTASATSKKKHPDQHHYKAVKNLSDRRITMLRCFLCVFREGVKPQYLSRNQLIFLWVLLGVKQTDSRYNVCTSWTPEIMRC